MISATQTVAHEVATTGSDATSFDFGPVFAAWADLAAYPGQDGLVGVHTDPEDLDDSLDLRIFAL